MSDEKLTEVLPVTRVTKSFRSRLDRIVSTSVTRQVSDHIRFAVERYVESEERNTGLPPIETLMATANGGGKTASVVKA